MNIGDKVVIARDSLDDYGVWLSKEGTLIFKCMMYRGQKRWKVLVNQKNDTSIIVFEKDLELING